MAVLVISYTRVHQPQVRSFVKFLRAALPNVTDAVFWDDDLEPGKPWSEQIRASIDGSPKLFVFWCGHAAASGEVRAEYAYALDQGKVVVPVLFDDTPLDPLIAGIHAIDLRDLVEHKPPCEGEPRRTSEPIDFEYATTVVSAIPGAGLSRDPGPTPTTVRRHVIDWMRLMEATDRFADHLANEHSQRRRLVDL